MDPVAPALLRRPMLRLLLASGTALFLELACIRWAGAHVLYLSYVSNLLLLCSFLGLGLGCLVAARRGADRVGGLVAAAPWLLLALCLVVALVEFEVVVDAPNAIYFSNERAAVSLPAWAVLPTLGALVTALFLALGAGVGRELAQAAPLRAYSFDIAGSLCGIALFTATSFLELGSETWFALAGLAWLPLLPANRGVLYASAACTLGTVGVVSWADLEGTWSPYQRVSVVALGPAEARSPVDPSAGTPEYRLRVQSITHQYVGDLRRREPFYEFPYRAAGAHPVGLPADTYLVDAPTRGTPAPVAATPAWGGRVLVVGAGTGTDVAFALAYGASHVDAVEIDPVLARLGRELHPDRPYADPRVAVLVEDGRAVLERAQGPYDLIVFGLPDSLTLASPYAGLRLESFLFTRQCLARALGLLEPERGLLVLYNYYRERWLTERLAATLSAAARGPVQVLLGPDRNLSATFLAGPGLSRVPADLGREWGFLPAALPASVTVTEDDWPFPYLREPHLPLHLGLAMGLIMGAALAGVGLVLWLTRPRERAPHSGTSLADTLPFFFMGAAFLLLETTGLVRMALNFGNTWLVNALVFFAVLSMVLIANLLASRLRLERPWVAYVLLLGGLGLAWSLPPEALATWPEAARYLGAAGVLFVPILLANLVFARAFRETPRPALAFGANLVGAVVGGSLEVLSLAVGYRALFVLAAALYVLAALCAMRRGPRASLSPP